MSIITPYSSANLFKRIHIIVFIYTLSLGFCQIFDIGIFDDDRISQNLNSNGNANGNLASSGSNGNQTNGAQGQPINAGGLKPSTLKFISEFLGPFISQKFKQPSTLDVLSNVLGLNDQDFDSVDEKDKEEDKNQEESPLSSQSELLQRLRLLRIQQLQQQLKLQEVIHKLKFLQEEPKVEQNLRLEIQKPPTLLEELTELELHQLQQLLHQRVLDQRVQEIQRRRKSDELQRLRLVLEFQRIQLQRQQLQQRNKQSLESKVGRSSSRYTLKTLGSNSLGINANVVIPNTDVDVISNVNVNTNLNGRGQSDSQTSQVSVRQRGTTTPSSNSANRTPRSRTTNGVRPTNGARTINSARTSNDARRRRLNSQLTDAIIRNTRRFYT